MILCIHIVTPRARHHAMNYTDARTVLLQNNRLRVPFTLIAIEAAALVALAAGEGRLAMTKAARAERFLEKPELVFGDKTVLQPGMVLAVDGSVSQSGFFRAQVGDSFIVTETGYEQITDHAKALDDVIL